MDAINDKSFPIYTANWKFKNMIVPNEVGQVLEYGITGWEFEIVVITCKKDFPESECFSLWQPDSRC